MKRFLRGLRIGLIGLAALALAGYGVAYGLSQRMLHRTYQAPLAAFSVPSDPALLAEGERLARIHSCFFCHGETLQGTVHVDQPFLVRIVAPGLTRIVREYSDAELERVIRRGVRRDGRSVWAMPSTMYYHLTDEDLGALLAYLRSVELREGLATEFRPRLLARLMIAAGNARPLAAQIDTKIPRPALDRHDPLALGRYLALTSCSGCHGADLRGGNRGRAPDLRIGGAFTPDAFIRLMREGVGSGGRELRLMGGVARSGFSHFTDAEITALYAYLRSLGAAGEQTNPLSAPPFGGSRSPAVHNGSTRVSAHQPPNER